MSNSRNFNSEIRMCTSTYYNGREIFCKSPPKGCLFDKTKSVQYRGFESVFSFKIVNE